MTGRTQTRVFFFLFIMCIANALASWAATGTTVWGTPAQLRQWISADPASNVVVSDRLESGRDFVRIVPGFAAWIAIPSPASLDLTNLSTAPAVFDPSVYNAVTITLRHNLPLNQLSGVWLHRSEQYDEQLASAPKFSAYSAPGDNQWHDIVLHLSDSALFKPSEPVVYISLAFVASSSTNLAALGNAGSTLYLDIDRIALTHVDEPQVPIPVITDFNPKKGAIYSEVTIKGAGFAEPANRNAVLFNKEPAEVLSGDANHLTVKVPVNGTLKITVLVPGGKQVTSEQSFVTLGPSAKIVIAAGDGQRGAPGSSLSPLSVRISDLDDYGLPAEKVKFRIISGEGTLSTTETTTDDQGIASTVLTLPPKTSTVQVEASVVGMFKTVTFTAIAAP